jgi:tetratricopeptide (TPR) repeat protein
VNCPRCQTDNPSTARFCLNCGESLKPLCPRCGAELPVNAKFCFQCGLSLSEARSTAVPPVLATSALERQLSALQAAGLVKSAANSAEGELAFRHALLQAAVYNSILLKQRHEVHARTALVLEKLFVARLSEQAAVLAYHFDQAGDARALKYYALAGDAESLRYANAEAVAHYRRAIELARRDGVGESGVSLRDLYLRCGRVLELLAQHSDALANYAQMEAEGQARGDRALELYALIEQAKLHSLPTNITDTSQVAGLTERAMTIARDSGDEAAEAKILWNMMIAYRLDSRLSDAAERGERAIAIARRLNAREQLAYTLNDISEIYMMLGRMERAKEVLAEASDLWRELNNLPMLTDNLNRLASNLTWMGEFARGLALSEQGYALSERIGNGWGMAFSYMFTGPALVELGRIDEAIARMNESVRFGAQVHYRATQLITRAYLARLYAELGRLDDALALAQLAQDTGALFDLFGPGVVGICAQLYLRAGRRAEAWGILDADPGLPAAVERNPMFNSDFTLALAEYWLDEGKAETALEGIERVIQRQYATGLRKDLLDALRLKARALIAANQPDEAAATLQTAQAEAERLGALWSLWHILAERAQFEQQRGSRAEARALSAKAYAQLSALAAKMSDPTLRASLLNTPQVRLLSSILTTNPAHGYE